MATKKPLVLNSSGGIEQLQADDALDALKEFTVPYASSVNIDWSQGDIAVLTLAGDCTISMTGTRKKCLLRLVQDTTGGHSIAFDATVRFGSDIPGVTLSTAAGKVDYIGLVYNTAAGKFDLIAYTRGY
ncbi:hypothetical protein N5B55_05250 [Ralstonia pickettii]|uniref:hypothetical protein n=1 Tax=Ralstonia pickettii TaxID=329 RepID=UPI002714DAE3|nr:hypothetical protein [Ralstonia pickettii]WKZ86362.1 hypothetical protein N5B55_05250 [Ralstonia pickettii]